MHLGFLLSELSNIESRPTLIQGAPVTLLLALLEDWIQWAPDDSRGSTDFATIESLKGALNDAGLGAAAHDLGIGPRKRRLVVADQSEDGGDLTYGRRA